MQKEEEIISEGGPTLSLNECLDAIENKSKI